MRLSLAAVLWGLVSTGSALVLPATEPGPEPTVPIGFSKAPFAKAVGRVFEIDGKVQYFAGTNVWYLAHLSNNSDVDIVLNDVAEAQYKIARVWGFGDRNTIPSSNATDPNRVWFQLLNATGVYINYGEDGLRRLDYVVSAAEKMGLKLVLNFVNNWSDYGGISAYNTAFGGNSDSWFTDKQSQQVYRNYIQVIVNRYKKSPAIFAWELANEARCDFCDYNVIVDWVNQTSIYIKSLDPDHMVTTGEEGFFVPSDGFWDGLTEAYDGFQGSSFTHNLNISTIDYGTFHMYPSSWLYLNAWGNTWIQQHDQVGEQLGKPVVLEEYGSPTPHSHTAAEVPWQTAVLESGIAADQVWEFGTNDLSVPPEDIFDEYTIYTNDTEYQVLAVEHAAQMLAKTVSS